MSAATSTPMTLEQVQALVIQDGPLKHYVEQANRLDFTMLKFKLRQEGMTAEAVSEAEGLYRMFLALQARHPDERLCPTGPIDTFWHAHILDTQAYAEDCETLFGRFLHHYPYFGMRDIWDKEELQREFDKTIDLFIRSFGIDPTAGDTQARGCRPQNCP
jgi:hypothetical protein